MTDQVIAFEKQQEWEDFAGAVYEEFGLNVMTGSSSASQIPTVAPFEDVKHQLSYSNILPEGEQSPIVVLDILVMEIDLAEGESSSYNADSLDEAVRKVVALYQARAHDLDCHLTGNFITADHKVNGALLRIYRNQDFVCKGHPELLLGKPIGMYHCDKCGEMQMAGTFHLPKEETANV